ncbi:histidine kinase dimerization/phospho-acceptor domain-containing protein, partial [Klebsiella pneumoniae]
MSLERARDAALAATSAKSTFLATMSHEMRTPLNAILGMNELLASTDLDPVQRDYADRAAASGSLLLDVVTDILDF